MTVRYLACLALGYLIGSLSVSILISKYILHQDVRTLGSGNAGAANAARTLGPRVGALTLLGDFLKGIISMLLGSWLGGTTGLAIAGAACMIGHCFPIYFGFKGGKGVLVGAGAALATEPLVCAALLVIFLIEVAVTHIVSLGSIIIAALYPAGTLINLIAHGASLPTIVFSTVCCVIMAAMVIWLHRSNIERLKNGTEYRFGEKK